MPKKIINFFKNNYSTIIVSLLVLFAFWIRVYRLDSLLGFYYDQGRDALVIWDFIHKGKLFLIGPTTGIEGIFRGPWYYWLITPFYFLGKGNPVYPAVFLASTTVLAIILLHRIVDMISGKLSAFIAVFLASFSYFFVYDARWLSNPTPMFLISTILIWSLFKVIDGNKWFWVLVSFCFGMAMQFGSAAEIFYFPAIFLVAILNRKSWPTFKIFIISVLVLFLVFVPQLIFDIKHNFILSKNIINFLTTAQSFKLSFWQTLNVRIPFYFETFFMNIFPSNSRISEILLFFLILFTYLDRKILFKNSKLLAIFIFIMSPLVGMLFFQGNSGNVYSYYFTGYFFIFTILLSVILGTAFKNPIGKIVVFSFLLIFIKDNLNLLNKNIIANQLDENSINLISQRKSIDWIFIDAKDKPFNVDYYVPPVIPYAYNYLTLWIGSSVYKKTPSDYQTSLLYTVIEPDPDHPERLDAWVNRQKGIAKVQKSQKFGPILVEQRVRIK